MQRLRIPSSILIVSLAAQAAAIPPVPPAQSGSQINRFNCETDTIVITKTWDYSKSSEHIYKVTVGKQPMSRTDAELLSKAIKQRGPFQAISVYCQAGTMYEVTLHNYLPTHTRLQVDLEGMRIKSIR